MKRLLAVFLVIFMLCAMFVVPSSAAGEAYINAKLDAYAVEGAGPRVDGRVGASEYGSAPALTYSKDKAQFDCPDDHDDYNNWDLDFHITWDEYRLYMAWVVKTDVHQPLVKGTYNYDGTLMNDYWPDPYGDMSQLGYMWMFSNLQFIITPGAPEYGTTDYGYNHNYLEMGICLLNDGDIGRIAWTYPKGVSAETGLLKECEIAVERNDNANTTVYEIAMPWEMTGLSKIGTDVSFGLAFTVGAQENYNIKKGMIEWNDAILAVKAPDKAGVITLKSDEKIEVDTGITVEGTVPAEANGKVQLAIDYINGYLRGEDISLQTDKNIPINNNWAYALLLAPVDGKENVYSIVAGKHGEGEPFTFDEYTDGMLILDIHSDGQSSADSESYPGFKEKYAAMNLPIGTELTLWGVDVENGKLLYSNAMFYAADVDADFMDNNKTPTSGTCGDNLTWSFDSEAGTLAISGEGDMYDYYVEADDYYEYWNAPWADLRYDIYNVDISEGVTSIGDCAFYGCSNIESIALPDGVTSIGERAFSFCFSLRNLSIPKSTTSIGTGAFNWCTIIKVIYGGTEKNWNAISIGESNEPLLDADIQFSACEHEKTEWKVNSDKTKEKVCKDCGEVVETLGTDEFIPNDVNGDNRFNVFDYYTVKTIYFKGTDDAVLFARADVNGDGRVNVFDYRLVKMAYFAQ